MCVGLKRHQTGANSQCEDVVSRELLECVDHGIKEANDILVWLVMNFERLSQNSFRANIGWAEERRDSQKCTTRAC